MNRKNIWKKQGSYKSFKTGKPMILVNDQKTGATVLEPLYKPKTDYGQAAVNALNRFKNREFGTNYPTGDAPEPGKQYRLTGGSGVKAISNGNSWAESVVECPVCDKPFINGTCQDCDKLVANIK